MSEAKDDAWQELTLAGFDLPKDDELVTLYRMMKLAAPAVKDGEGVLIQYEPVIDKVIARSAEKFEARLESIAVPHRAERGLWIGIYTLSGLTVVLASLVLFQALA